MKTNLILFFVILCIPGFAATYQVGSTKDYLSPNALYLANILQDGDTVEIDAETYTGTAALAVWQPNNLVIKGISGLARLDADGQNIWGKGIWVLAGDDITVENIEFFGATVPDNNGAGIRLDGTGMNVQGCYFHDNENGILTSNPGEGEITIEYSEFDNNGYGEGFTHNLYIGHVEKLTFRFNYSHHAKIGHNLKSRANENHILYNRIMDEETGESSRLVDLSNGGFSILMGNLFMQGNNAPNNNLIGYGLEGLSNTSPHEFYFINNTLVNKRTASCLFLHINEETSIAKVSNNIFAGTGDIQSGTIVELTTNFIETSIENVNFIDEVNYDYQLSLNSPAIDIGTLLPSFNGHSLTPGFAYLHPINGEERTISNNLIDVGAFEYDWMISAIETPNISFSIYPNPVSDVLKIDIEASQINSIHITDVLGKSVFLDANSNVLDLSDLADGVYFLVIELENQRNVVRKIIME